MVESLLLDHLQTVLDYRFNSKPLLVGGGAMEYYGLRSKGEDTDFIIHKEDYQALASKYPYSLRDIFSDLGVVKDGFELWRTIMLFDYDHLSVDAVKFNGLLVVSLEKLLLLKALGISESKYEADLRLIVKKIIDNQYRDYKKNE